MSSETNNLSPTQVLEAIEKLGTELTHLNPKQSASTLSHYRTLPLAVTQSYDLMTQGATLVHATSTKYTLLGKIDLQKAHTLAADLLRGCQLLATACIALFDDSTGCCRSTRMHVRKAARSIVGSVHSLLQAFHTGDALKNKQVGAQKTGVVWQHCNVILEKKLPRGNRSSIRRDLLTYQQECNETMAEFQEMIDLGPSNGATEDTFESFLEGGTDQYTETELPMASAALTIIKCSRGCLTVSLQAMEAIDEQDENQLQYVNNLLDRVVAVGDGMTDFGSCLYSPLNHETLRSELTHQCGKIRSALDLIRSQDLPSPVLELAGKIGTAIETREQEVTTAIDSC